MSSSNSLASWLFGSVRTEEVRCMFTVWVSLCFFAFFVFVLVFGFGFALVCCVVWMPACPTLHSTLCLFCSVVHVLGLG